MPAPSPAKPRWRKASGCTERRLVCSNGRSGGSSRQLPWSKFGRNRRAPSMANTNLDPSLVRLEFPIAGCAIVTLDRPAAMNALSLAMRKQLAATIDDLRSAPDVRVVIVTGAGKAFCAGLDLKELGASRDLASTIDPAGPADPVGALRRFPGPVIGAINDAAVT